MCTRQHLNLLLTPDIRLVLGLSIGLKDSGCLDSCRSEGNVESDKGHLLTGRTFSFAPKPRTFNQTRVTQTLLVSKYLYQREQDFQVFLAGTIFNQTKATGRKTFSCTCVKVFDQRGQGFREFSPSTICHKDKIHLVERYLFAKLRS